MRKDSQAFIDYLSPFSTRFSEFVSNLVTRDALLEHGVCEGGAQLFDLLGSGKRAL